MKITDHTGKSKVPYIKIVDSQYVDDYRLLLTFNDGISRIVDFGGFLRAHPHPDIKKYLDVERFKKFHLEYGDLMWGDFNLIFPISDLYRGGKLTYEPPKKNSISPNGKKIDHGRMKPSREAIVQKQKRKKLVKVR